MGMKDIRIRTACGGDAQALLEIYAPYVEHTAITFEYETPERSDFRKRLENTLKKYPYMQLFIDSVRYEEVAEALCATEEKKNVLPEALESLMKGADTSRFTPEVKLQKLNRLIEYTLRGMMEDCFLENSFQPDMMYEEINSYLLMLKKLTYQ